MKFTPYHATAETPVITAYVQENLARKRWGEPTVNFKYLPISFSTSELVSVTSTKGFENSADIAVSDLIDFIKASVDSVDTADEPLFDVAKGAVTEADSSNLLSLSATKVVEVVFNGSDVTFLSVAKNPLDYLSSTGLTTLGINKTISNTVSGGESLLMLFEKALQSSCVSNDLLELGFASPQEDFVNTTEFLQITSNTYFAEDYLENVLSYSGNEVLNV